MNAPSQNRPLTDDEIEALEARLLAVDPDDSMAVEELDGFLAAIACCPEPVPREEWLPMVLGESPRARAALAGEGEDAALLKLIERHRVAVAAMLYDGEGFAPVLAYDEDGNAWGNAWAIGFARGMSLRPDAWAPLEDDDDYADALDPVMRLVADARQDDDEDDGLDGTAVDTAATRGAPPASRAAAPRRDDEDEDDEDFEPVSDDERESVIHDMFDGVQDVFDFFREARERALAPATVRREGAKVGRNDPCPCGSGRKHKNCCGAPGAVH
ncbi:MAG TPA: UPF0149 family protein [Burkholderiaceae bacterium]|nr:UPF0149 family protein [Burkholderiaceae bacterium]